jgi:GT2 family glycosyltransferase
MSKIGLGIVTCNRPDFLSKCIESIDLEKLDVKAIVNDGTIDVKHQSFHIMHNKENLGVGKSKNKLLKYLRSQDCDYIFLLEDDMLILDNNVFDKYIEAYKASGIHHFNYGPGSPFNRKQNFEFDLHNRHLCDQHSDPNPRKIIDYGNDVKISLFTHTVAMFSFFTKEVLDKVGYIDEDFYNAWEHVDHTYRIIKEGYHPPFWYFADIFESHLYLSEAPEAIDKSSIANDNEQWKKNVYGGIEIYKKKHGHVPNMPPPVTDQQVIESLKKIKNERCNNF